MEHFNIAFCQWDFYCLVDSLVLLDSYYSINEAKLIYTVIRLPLFPDASRPLLKCTDRTDRYRIRRRTLRQLRPSNILPGTYLTLMLEELPRQAVAGPMAGTRPILLSCRYLYWLQKRRIGKRWPCADVGLMPPAANYRFRHQPHNARRVYKWVDRHAEAR
jgi:hypothetical protein